MSSAAPRSDSIRLAGRSRDREPVVLRGDRDPAGGEVLDRVVGAAVAERELERLQAGRAREQLVAEADPEHRLAHEQRADRVDEVVERRRVAGAGHEEEAVGVARQQLVGRRRARVQLELHAARDEVADDRALDAGVERDDPQPAALALDRAARDSVTSRARSRPTIDGSARTRSIASAAAIAAGKIPPRIAPAERMCRTSARVSTPVIPGTPCAASQSSQPCSAPGASVVLTASRMIAPAAWMRSDSHAPALTP